MIPPRIEGGDHPLWADEAEVQSVQRDSKTSQPPNVRNLIFICLLSLLIVLLLKHIICSPASIRLLSHKVLEC